MNADYLDKLTQVGQEGATPRPWEAGPPGHPRMTATIWRVGGDPVMAVNGSPSDNAFVVAAVNQWDDLLAVVRAAEAYLELTHGRLNTVHAHSTALGDAYCDTCVFRRLDGALAALRAKAEAL